MALDLEDDGVAIADIDDPGILPGPQITRCTGRRQGAQPDLRGFVRAVLAPHGREDAELGLVRHAAEDRNGALELLRCQPVLDGEGRGDIAA